MAGRTLVYGQDGDAGPAGAASNMNSFFLQNQGVACPSSQLHHDSLFISGSSPSFLGKNL